MDGALLVRNRAMRDARAGPSVPDFRMLLGAQAWTRLPPAVQRRFAPQAHASEPVVYRGTMSVRASLFGRCLAWLCLLLGTPVVPFVQEDVPIAVHVYDLPHGGGTVWKRVYRFDAREPVTISSIKRQQDGALVEALGAGLRMRLNVFEERGALHFVSTGYFFEIGRWRIALPDWLAPGVTHVVHEDHGDGSFRFTMRTQHPRWGLMYDQSGVFS
jgi:Domain of unknown function (DUF4166)